MVLWYLFYQMVGDAKIFGTTTFSEYVHEISNYLQSFSHNSNYCPYYGLFFHVLFSEIKFSQCEFSQIIFKKLSNCQKYIAIVPLLFFIHHFRFPLLIKTTELKIWCTLTFSKYDISEIKKCLESFLHRSFFFL